MDMYRRQWNTPTCSAMACTGKPNATAANITHGHIASGCSDLASGKQCNVTCDAGYDLKGSVECNLGKYVYTAECEDKSSKKSNHGWIVPVVVIAGVVVLLGVAFFVRKICRQQQ